MYFKLNNLRSMQIQMDQRAQKKAQRRQKQAQKHLQKFTNHKNEQYFDQGVDSVQKVKYYSQIDLSNPQYQPLSELISSTFKHARRRENFFPLVDRHPDHTLRCVYSGQILSNADGQFLQKCDQQHSFPQSYQRGTKMGTGRDMHAIFAAGKSANGSRGNVPFGNFGKIIQQDVYGTNYKDGSLKTYQPKINRGPVARASLYILTCYKNSANQNYLPKRCLQWLVKNATQNQVTLWEKHRNQQLYKLQGNRNPFIDFPELANFIDFTEGWQKIESK